MCAPAIWCYQCVLQREVERIDTMRLLMLMLDYKWRSVGWTGTILMWREHHYYNKQGLFVISFSLLYALNSAFHLHYKHFALSCLPFVSSLSISRSAAGVHFIIADFSFFNDLWLVGQVFVEIKNCFLIFGQKFRDNKKSIL